MAFRRLWHAIERRPPQALSAATQTHGWPSMGLVPIVSALFVYMTSHADLCESANDGFASQGA